MRGTVKEQIRTHYRALDDVQEDVQWDEIAARLEDVSAPVALPGNSANAGWRRGSLVAASAVVVLAFIALPTLLNHGPSDSVDLPPVATHSDSEPVTTPSIAPSEPTAVPVARIAQEARPFGEPVVQHSAAESVYTPVGSHWTTWMGGLDLGSGSVVATESGYVAVGGHIASDARVVITSTDGLTWEPIATTGLEDLRGTATMFEAHGAYWIQRWFADGGTFDFSLFRSHDLQLWEEVNLSPVADDPALASSTWVSFSDRLVAFGGGGIAVDPETLETTILQTPWGANRRATSAFVTETGLHVMVGSDGIEGSQVEEYETSDLETWSRPALPSPLHTEVRVWDLPTGTTPDIWAVTVQGGPGEGYVASIQYQAADFRGELLSVSHFSEDGEEWSIASDPNDGSPESATAEQIVPTYVQGRLALIAQMEELGRPGSVLISEDGIEWQQIPLDVTPSPGIKELPDAAVHKSMDVVGNKIFYYYNTQGWLNSWLIALPGS